MLKFDGQSAAAQLCDYLTAVPSPRGGEENGSILKSVYARLKHVPYFASHEDSLALIGADSPRVLLALLTTAPSPAPTLVLIAHADTAQAKTFGDYKNDACRPEVLKDLLINIAARQAQKIERC